MPTTKRKKQSKTQKQLALRFEQASQTDYHWISPLAKKIGNHAPILAKFLSHVLVELAAAPLTHSSPLNQFELLKSITKILFPKTKTTLTKMEEILHKIQSELGEASSEILKNTELTQELLSPLIEVVCSAIESNPQLVLFFKEPEILEEAFGVIGERLTGLVHLIPALSSHAAEKFPDLKEKLFHALFQLEKKERQALYTLAEDIMGEVYRSRVFPQLQKTLAHDPRGKVLSPILLGAISAVPGESCINALLSIACTPAHEFSNGRIIAIAIQEMGGLYIKVAQVISELCPPRLARELRTTQDDAGGIFPSMERSWEHLLEVLKDAEYAEWTQWLQLPHKPQRHFASASVGALYNIPLTATGQARWGVQNVLIKLQRPRLREIFALQCDHILSLVEQAHQSITNDTTLILNTRQSLLGLLSALKRAILNYHKQVQEEFDFTSEERNANKVRNALGKEYAIHIPRFFYSSEHLVFMERMPGVKVTKMVQTKYLERREIADNIAKAYIDLVFSKGVVWADPHPGNILFDDMTNQISMIDLNPCFVWETKTREEFKHLIYRLLLRDANGIYQTLVHLVENTENLQSDLIIDKLHHFLSSSLSNANLNYFVGEFIKTLNENQIDLKIEVQAALRGLSQIALTTASISARNSFGFLLRKKFALRELLKTFWNVGVFRGTSVILSTLFEFTGQLPGQDIGPVLDERDLAAISTRIHELERASVCSIRLRRVLPEDHPNLKMSQDGQTLLVTSDLYIEIIDRVKPATVRYVIEIPSRQWLKERQEFVKLASIARSFCIIECLEQLRRNSLDNYWRIVEAWGKSIATRTHQETKLVGEATMAARKLYLLRFKNIWNASFIGLPWVSQQLWKFLMRIEVWKEVSTQKYLISQKKKADDLLLTSVAYSTFFRLRILMLMGVLWCLKKIVREQRFSMHLLPMSTKELEDLILFGLSRSSTGTRR